MLLPSVPHLAFKRTERDRGDADPETRDKDHPDEQRRPVLWIVGPEGHHRFLFVAELIVIGRDAACDVAIGHHAIALFHLELTPKKGHVELVTMGDAVVWVSGERFSGAQELPYRCWFHFSDAFKGAVTRHTREEPYDWPPGEPWRG